MVHLSNDLECWNGRRVSNGSIVRWGRIVKWCRHHSTIELFDHSILYGKLEEVLEISLIIVF